MRFKWHAVQLNITFCEPFVRESSVRTSSVVPSFCESSVDSLQTLVKPTVAKGFLGSMQDLNVTLLSTTCNFVRCIKPNAAMQCGLYDNR